MRHYILITALLLTGTSQAQQLLPRPYTFVGREAMGGGYAPIAAETGAGFRIDSKHLLFRRKHHARVKAVLSSPCRGLEGSSAEDRLGEMSILPPARCLHL